MRKKKRSRQKIKTGGQRLLKLQTGLLRTHAAASLLEQRKRSWRRFLSGLTENKRNGKELLKVRAR